MQWSMCHGAIQLLMTRLGSENAYWCWLYLLLALMKILVVWDFIIKFHSLGLYLAYVCCRIRSAVSRVPLLEGLKCNEVFAKEVNVLEDRTVVKCMAGFATRKTRLGCVKAVGGDSVDIAVAESFEVVHSRWDGDVVRSILVKDGINLLMLWWWWWNRATLMM